MILSLEPSFLNCIYRNTYTQKNAGTQKNAAKTADVSFFNGFCKGSCFLVMALFCFLISPSLVRASLVHASAGDDFENLGDAKNGAGFAAAALRLKTDLPTDLPSELEGLDAASLEGVAHDGNLAGWQTKADGRLVSPRGVIASPDRIVARLKVTYRKKYPDMSEKEFGSLAQERFDVLKNHSPREGKKDDPETTKKEQRL